VTPTVVAWVLMPPSDRDVDEWVDPTAGGTLSFQGFGICWLLRPIAMEPESDCRVSTPYHARLIAQRRASLAVGSAELWCGWLHLDAAQDQQVVAWPNMYR